MRFLNGWLGAFAGLTITSMLLGALAGSTGVASLGAIITNVVISAIAAGIIKFTEKPSWGFARYAVAGLYTTGTILAILFIVTLLAITTHLQMQVTPVMWLVTIVPAAICGALSGIGYRTISGVKPE